MSKKGNTPAGAYCRPPPAPRKDPPPDAVERIRALAAEGWSIRGIASAFGIGYDLLAGRWFEEYPELREAMEAGREEERHALHNRLFRMAMEGEGRDAVIAAMFLLKARHGYREGDAQTDGRVAVTFNMPAALPLDKFVTIENDPEPAPDAIPTPPAVTTRRG